LFSHDGSPSLRFLITRVRRLAGEREWMKGRNSWLCLALVLLGCALFPRGTFASAALLLEQPYGSFGFLNPTGHAAIYLSDVCAASPTHLRRCHAGEYGVVISRYHHVAGRDWLAIPVISYLYAVDHLSQIPVAANRETEAALRDAWRCKHLEPLVPDTADGSAPAGEWTQLVGSLYDRKIYVYEVDTTEKQDDALIAKLNRQRNRSHFNLFFNNCADFARSILDFYYPHAVHRSFTADLGMTTPKQIAKSLAHYGNRHERTDLAVFVLPQVAGSIPRSSKVDGGAGGHDSQEICRAVGLGAALRRRRHRAHVPHSWPVQPREKRGSPGTGQRRDRAMAGASFRRQRAAAGGTFPYRSTDRFADPRPGHACCHSGYADGAPGRCHARSGAVRCGGTAFGCKGFVSLPLDSSLSPARESFCRVFRRRGGRRKHPCRGHAHFAVSTLRKTWPSQGRRLRPSCAILLDGQRSSPICVPGKALRRFGDCRPTFLSIE